jgi:hypothetical protein
VRLKKTPAQNKKHSSAPAFEHFFATFLQLARGAKQGARARQYWILWWDSQLHFLQRFAKLCKREVV